VLRRRPRTELVIAESATHGLDALAARVPDVLLTSPLLSPQDETTLAEWLRSIGPDTRHGPGPYLMGADTLIGNDVCNEDGEDLGAIKEIMLDMRSGNIVYAVLAFGGTFGMGEKLFAVPWRALVLDTENKRFVLKVVRDRLKEAPGFDKNHWPNMADQTWVRKIHDYYGTKQPSVESRV
jgi:sporulation protein YlmC with PRC-barrel domain